jgi:hypothetical protein
MSELPPDAAEGTEIVPVDEEHGRGCPPGERLSGRQKVMCEMHLAGFTHREIAKHMGMHEVSVGLALRRPRAQEYINERVGDLNGEFSGLFRHVIDTFHTAFTKGDIDTRLAAADKWLRAHGRYTPKAQKDERPTVEDIIGKILDAKRDAPVNVQINVGSEK